MFEVAIVSAQGRRPNMEDTYYFRDFRPDSQAVLGMVFDGHGGSFAAEYAKTHLPRKFLEAVAGGQTPQAAFLTSYQEVDDELAGQDSGTTALSFYLKDRALFFANVGDGRLIIIARNTAVKPLTRDHRIEDPEERARILQMGGQIIPPYIYKDGAGLMTTRSLGDEYFKDVGVVATAEVGSYNLQTQDKWMLAGTDGLFDYLTNQEAADFLLPFQDGESAAAALRNEIFHKRASFDNFTFILIYYPGKL